MRSQTMWRIDQYNTTMLLISDQFYYAAPLLFLEISTCHIGQLGHVRQFYVSRAQ